MTQPTSCYYNDAAGNFFCLETLDSETYLVGAKEEVTQIRSGSSVSPYAKATFINSSMPDILQKAKNLNTAARISMGIGVTLLAIGVTALALSLPWLSFGIVAVTGVGLIAISFAILSYRDKFLKKMGLVADTNKRLKENALFGLLTIPLLILYPISICSKKLSNHCKHLTLSYWDKNGPKILPLPKDIHLPTTTFNTNNKGPRYVYRSSNNA